jgi:hypothetical protein
MSVKSVNFDSSYVVGGGAGAVTLSVIVGDGQFGTSLVTADATDFPPGDVSELELGTASALRGTLLKIKTIVTDINDRTNSTSLTYSLRGGVAPLDAIVSATVDEEGGSVVYRATFQLT